MLRLGYTASSALVIPRAGQDYSAMSKTAEPNLQNAPILLREDRAGGVCVVTLNRPAARNSLSRAMLQALEDMLADIAADTTCRVVVLAGAGTVFCAGHDLREITAHRADADGGRGFYADAMAACARVMQGIVRLPQPVIAAVQGVATAAGCQLVASCDLAVAAEDARVQQQASNPVDLHDFRVGVVMDARMSEVYAGAYQWQGEVHQWQPLLPLQVGAPEAVVQNLCELMGSHFALAGNGLDVYKDRLSLQTLEWKARHVLCIPAMPHANALLRLAPVMWRNGGAVLPELVQPLYVRDKVAQTTVEREAIKEAKALLNEAINAQSEGT
jgi:tRNA threonylcarbamoyl adenosine modification protein YeaZ